MTYERIFIGMIEHIEYSLPVFDTVDSFFFMRALNSANQLARI